MHRLLRACALALVAVAATAALAAAEVRLVSYGDQGLRVGDTTLFAKPVGGAAHDAAQELVWFRSGSTLYVLDLREAAPKPVAIATRFPDGGFAIDGVSKTASDTTYAGLYPVLVVGKSPKIKTGMGAYGGMWEEQDAENKKAIKKIKLTGKKWLTRQAKRAPRAGAKAPVVGGFSETVVPLNPPQADECDGASIECGTLSPFGDTGYHLVVISSSCGDACHSSCVLYDARTKRYANPTATSTWTATIPADTSASCFPENYGLRAGGEYFAGFARCTVGAKGTTCSSTEGWTHVGWVE